jgi:hypothetical protein
MVTEWQMIALMATSGVLFAVGGTGYKWARRFLLPAVFGAFNLYQGVSWWQCLGFTVGLSAVLHPGYGDRANYWKRALLFTGYGVVYFWLGFTWWIVIIPPLFLGIFTLSNWKGTAEAFFWKGCEFLWGVILALAFIDSLK